MKCRHLKHKIILSFQAIWKQVAGAWVLLCQPPRTRSWFLSSQSLQFIRSVTWSLGVIFQTLPLNPPLNELSLPIKLLVQCHLPIHPNLRIFGQGGTHPSTAIDDDLLVLSLRPSRENRSARSDAYKLNIKGETLTSKLSHLILTWNGSPQSHGKRADPAVHTWTSHHSHAGTRTCTDKADTQLATDVAKRLCHLHHIPQRGPQCKLLDSQFHLEIKLLPDR